MVTRIKFQGTKIKLAKSANKISTTWIIWSQWCQSLPKPINMFQEVKVSINLQNDSNL